jgi:hypothetical protein
VLGIQVPIVMGIGMLLLGAVLMLSAWALRARFFARRPETAPADALVSGPEAT